MINICPKKNFEKYILCINIITRCVGKGINECTFMYSWTAERLLFAEPRSLTKLYMQTKSPLINPRPVLDSLVQ